MPPPTAPLPEFRVMMPVLAWLALLASCKPPQEESTPPPAPVRVETVQVREVPLWSEYIGTVRSRDATDIRAQVTGRITSIAVEAGQQVQARQILMRIDQGRQQAMLSRARAAKASAVSDLERARADLTALSASREAATSRVAFARAQRRRVRALFAADNASREEYERATTELERAVAEVSALTAQLKAQRAEIASLQAAVDESRSSVREGQAELSFYNVEAPIAGRLGDVPVRVGDLVVPSTLLTSLEGNSLREVYVQVPVDKRTHLRTGLTLQIIDEQGGVLGEGQLSFVAPQVDERTQTVLVKAPLAGDSPVVPGQYVRARVVWERARGPTLPPAAILRVNTQPFAFVLDGEAPNTVTQVAITLGPLHGGRYLVETGLTPGQRVVVAGIQRLNDGAEITLDEGHTEHGTAHAHGDDKRAGNPALSEAPADPARTPQSSPGEPAASLPSGTDNATPGEEQAN